MSAVQGNSVGSSGIAEGEAITETVSSDHELASAAAAVENDRQTLQEAVTSPGEISKYQFQKNPGSADQGLRNVSCSYIDGTRTIF